jgi:hypothetical protein
VGRFGRRRDSMRRHAPDPAVMHRIRDSWREIAGALIVLVTRLLTAPQTFWEHDELLFAQGVRQFEPLLDHPHPPGFPLYIAIGKCVDAVLHDPFRSLVGISIISCVAGYVALCLAFGRLLGDRDLGAAGALLVYFSAAVLVHGTLPMSDSPALMFFALALLASSHAAGARSSWPGVAAAIFCSAAIGVRPQYAVALLPFLAVVLWQMRTTRQRLNAAASFIIVSVAWFFPLVAAVGDLGRFFRWERRQAVYFAAHDASQSRGALGWGSIAIRFVLHPWGSKYVTVPLLLCMVAGIFWLARRVDARWLPLALFTVVQLAFSVITMDPADAARYSIPLIVPMALVAAAGFGAIREWTPLRAAPYALAALLALVSITYVSPILDARVHSPSPPAAAAAYARDHLSPDTVVLYEPGMRPHAEYLMARFHPIPFEAGLRRFYDRPEVPLVLLADGGSPEADSKVFRWPMSDAYGKLTRNHYRVVTLDEISRRERYLPLRGVYDMERTVEGEEWRWLESDALIRLPRSHTGALAVTLRLSPDTPYGSSAVDILVNGTFRLTTSVGRTPATTVVPIPAAADVVVEFRSARSFSPAKVLGNKDPRVLAVQLVRVEQR